MAIITLFLLLFGDSVLGPIHRTYLLSISGKVRNKAIYPFMSHSNHENFLSIKDTKMLWSRSYGQAGEWTKNGLSRDGQRMWQITREQRNEAVIKCIMLGINMTKNKKDSSCEYLQLRSPWRSENSWSSKWELDSSRVWNWQKSFAKVLRN